MKEAPSSISFPEENYQIYIDSYNKKRNNQHLKWVHDGSLVEVEKWIYISKNILQKKENKLENWYSLLDLNVIILNTSFENQKKYYKNEVERLNFYINDYFSNNRDKRLFTLLGKHIIEQPLHLLEAIEKYPDSLSKNKKIYYRYIYLINKFVRAEAKTYQERKGLENWSTKISNHKDKNRILNVFSFVERFINEFPPIYESHYKYTHSEVFKLMFDEIIKIKGYYEEVFNSLKFANIVSLEKELSIFQDKPLLSGFNCQLPTDIIKKIHFQMVENKYIVTDLENFKTIFSKIIDKEFRPIIWSIETKKKQAHKTALFVFIKRMLGQVSNDIIKVKTPKFFEDKKGKAIIIKTYPKPDEQLSINYFDDIKQLPILPD